MELAENLLSTRRGTLLVGAGAALLALIVLLVYLGHYRSSVSGAGAPASVLVAKNLIQKGTPGDVVGSTSEYQVASVPKNDLKNGALVDASTLQGRVAVRDIYPGEQLTSADFSVTPTDAIGNKLTASDRAIAVPFDSAHGLIGQLQEGDHVDIYVGLTATTATGTKPVLKLLMSNALVLRAPSSGSGNIVFRADARHAEELAFAADNGKLWVVLRPASGAKASPPSMVSVETLLFGTRPLAVR